jgi:transglutaminase/protease-like cytokinesis protein 3
LLIDATWGAGSLTREKEFIPEFSDAYFNTSVDKFNLDHYAEDSKWRFSNISKRKFEKRPLYFKKYIKSNFIVVSPKKGIVKVKSQKAIIIKISANAHPKDIMYHFSREKYGHELLFKKIRKIL